LNVIIIILASDMVTEGLLASVTVVVVI